MKHIFRKSGKSKQQKDRSSSPIHDTPDSSKPPTLTPTIITNPIPLPDNLPLSVGIDHSSARSVASACVPASASISSSNAGQEASRNPGKSKLLETPTIFPALRNAIIQGGTFIQTSASNTSEGFKILQGNIAVGAFHNSGERFDPPKCHPNTRVAVLAEIMKWIEAIEESEDVLWLYGSAGAGKSAICQTIAEKCAKLNLLVASFFFSRASHSRNNEKCLIASIAYQLAISIPATRSYIESAVQIDPAVFHKSLDTQIETLIIGPLENAYSAVNSADAIKWPRLIIIDGLDECHDPLIQCSIIRVLSDALRRITVPLLLLIASRPEPHIRHAFNVLNKSHPSRHIVLDDSYEPDADIKTFLLDRFHEIKENHQFSTNIPIFWPSEEIIDRLVRKSSGQFIYASTVIKYLESPKRLPMKQLDVIMGLRPIDGDMPYKELDALYSYVFSCVEDLAITLKILGFLFFGDPSRSFTPRFLALLVGLDEEDVHIHLSELHSILHIPPPPNRDRLEIQPTHASLQDFLVDRQRSVKYYFDEEEFHTDVARQCLRQISMLVMNPELEDISEGWQEYFVWAFTHHCIGASTDSSDLINELMQVSGLCPFFRAWPTDVPKLFTWLYKADGPAGKELSSHIQSLWDRYLTSTLDQHTFDRRNVDIARLLFFPHKWHCWFSLVSEVPDILIWDSEGYVHFLADFFEDKNRSGKYHVNGTVYARAALECFQNMINPNADEIFNPYPFVVLGIERPDVNLFMSIPESVTSQREILIPKYREGLDAVVKLLFKAAPLTDLYLYLRDHPLQNPSKAKVHCEHGFGSLRLAVKAYLDRCKYLVPKVLRRSASFPLYSSNVDLDLEFEGHLWTFNEQWPLASDGKIPSYLTQRRIRNMRESREITKLRSRIKVIPSRDSREGET